MSGLAYYRSDDIIAVEKALRHAGSMDALQSLAIVDMAIAFCAQYQSSKRIGILCDTGSTGKIARQLARQLADRGKEVKLFTEASLPISQPLDLEVIIDGLSTALSPFYAEMAGSGIPVVALDAPGGIDRETGAAVGEIFPAERTYVLWYPLLGLSTGDGLAAAGAVEVYGEVPQSISPAITSCAIESVLDRIQPRASNSHKGIFGSVLVVAGDREYFGALLLVVRGLIAMGVGVIRVITTSDHVHRLVDLHPHIMAIGHEDKKLVKIAITEASTILAGPGIAGALWFAQMLPLLLQAERRLVLDAGALPLITQFHELSAGAVVTPHPGEAATLLQCSAADIQQQRYRSATTIRDKYQVFTVLKGFGTIVAPPDGMPLVCPYGNPGMAVAGMGDVLAAFIAAKVAQDGLCVEAIVDAVYLHAYIGDRLEQEVGQIGIEPSQVIAMMRQILNQRRGNG